MFGSKARDGAIDAAAKRKRVLEEERVAVFRDERASRHAPMFGRPRGTNAPAPVVRPDTRQGLAPRARQAAPTYSEACELRKKASYNLPRPPARVPKLHELRRDLLAAGGIRDSQVEVRLCLGL
jgi:hypothetical protein